MSAQGRAQPLSSSTRSHPRSGTKLTCVEWPVTETQRSLDLSILERQVTAAPDSQECKVTDSKQP